jgi:hypothetical protein
VTDADQELVRLISHLTDECQVLERISWRYSVAQMPGAIWPEEEPNLILRYAADEPEAIVEVRSRHGLP